MENFHNLVFSYFEFLSLANRTSIYIGKNKENSLTSEFKKRRQRRYNPIINP